MQIVIDIPDYSIPQNNGLLELQMMCFRGEIWQCSFPFKVLPKGHGRLIDADKTIATAWTNFYKHEDEWEKKDNDYLPIGRLYSQNGFECCQQTIVDAPTIIEADATESEDKE